MSDSYIGEIRIFSFKFAPRGWFLCDGQLLNIVDYTALFSLLSTIYGGNGHSTFGLPNFNGRIPISYGAGPGLINDYAIGDVGGFERQFLTMDAMAAHSHNLLASEDEANTDDPSNAVFGNTRSNTYVKPNPSSPPPLNTKLIEDCISATGKGLAVDNMQPSLCLNFCICAEGVYPPRQ